jgi:hypothetical protein
MKTLLFLFCAYAICLSACTKSDIQPSTNAVSTVSEENASILRMRSAMLLAHPWMYQEFDFHYIDQHHRGDIQYLRGGSQNVINLDDTRFIFRKDGTFKEYDGGYIYPGKWRFSDNTATLLILNFQNWTDDDSILVLNNNHLKYTQPMGYHDKSYTELITATQ